jgi:hypothetical protein
MITKNEARWIFYIVTVNSIPSYDITQQIVVDNIKGEEHDEDEVFDKAIKFSLDNGAVREEKYLRITMKSAFDGFMELDSKVRQVAFNLKSLPID